MTYLSSRQGSTTTLAQVLPPASLDQNWEILGGRPTNKPVSAIGVGVQLIL